MVFMDQDFAHPCQIPRQELEETRQVDVIDGRPIESVDNTHVAKVDMKIHDHVEQLAMLLQNWDIVQLST